MKTLIVDIESDSLDTKTTNIFCIVGYDLEAKEFHTFDCRDPQFISKFMSLVGNYDVIVAHNGIKFDLNISSKPFVLFKIGNEKILIAPTNDKKIDDFASTETKESLSKAPPRG